MIHESSGYICEIVQIIKSNADVDRPWDALVDDQLALLDHLGIDEFMVLGFCIGGPMIWNLIKHAGDRVVAATLVHPSGYTSSHPNNFYNNNIKGWAPAFRERRASRGCEGKGTFCKRYVLLFSHAGIASKQRRAPDARSGRAQGLAFRRSAVPLLQPV